jgi:hypothetical protein
MTGAYEDLLNIFAGVNRGLTLSLASLLKNLNLWKKRFFSEMLIQSNFNSLR